MSKLIFCFLFNTLFFSLAHGQKKLPEIYLNHVYVVLDSTTYNNLFDSAFINKKLGNTKSSSISTTEGSWTGKYLYGKNAYFEFFSTKGLTESSEGDFGLAFMTFKTDDIWNLEKYWKENSSDSIKRDTTTYISNGKPQSWFYSIGLFRKDSTEPISTWIMENTPEELQSAGFSTEEIKNEINWQTYVKKLSNALFTKSFNRINSVQLSLNKKQYKYLKKSLIGFGLRKKGKTFFNKHIRISYTIDEATPVRVKLLETELTELFPSTNIKISNSLSIQVTENKAFWKFTYLKPI